MVLDGSMWSDLRQCYLNSIAEGSHLTKVIIKFKKTQSCKGRVNKNGIFLKEQLRYGYTPFQKMFSLPVCI